MNKDLEINRKKMIRICHVTSVHPTFDTRIFHKECRSLAKKYEVFLVVANAKDEERDGVHIVGVPLAKSRIKRILSASKMESKLITINASVYHFHDPELLPVGIKMKKLGKKIVFDSHEDIPMQLLTKEWIPQLLRKPLSRIYALYEKRIMRQYNALITVTPTITERLKQINHNTYQITNFPEYKEFSDNRSWDRKVCFTGGVDSRYMHETILKSLDNIDVKYILAGPLDSPTYLKKLEQLPSWEKVDYKGVLSFEECIKLMQQSSAGLALIGYTPNVGYKKGTLGVLKIFEYMMAGIPVIATDSELWKEIVEGNNCGICVNPYDKDAIANAINTLINDPVKCQEMGNNGKNAVRELYTWKSQEEVLFNLYQKITNNIKDSQ